MTSIRSIAAFLVVASGLGAAPAALLFRHAILVDPARNLAQPGMAILVEGDRIMKIGPDADLAPGLAKVVDLRGAYVIPGLIDTHVHLGTEPNLSQAKAHLRLLGMGGVVAVRDMAGDCRFLADLRRQVLVGEVQGPRVFYSALMAGPAFFADARTKASTLGEVPGKVAWMQGITKDTDLVQAVAQARGTYASGIKLYANLDADLTARIVAEARRQNFPVWSHGALFPAKPSDVVRTGLTSISHASMIVYEVATMPEARREQRPEADYAVPLDHPAFLAVLRLMKEKEVALDATLSVFRRVGETNPGKLEKARKEYAFGVGITRLAHRMGVRVTTGTDWVGRAAKRIPAVWEELITLQDEAGFTPAEALAAGTLEGARLLGLSAEDGELAAGRRADFAVLREDPLKDVKAVRSLRLTVIGGRILDRSTYRPDPVLQKMKD